MKHQFGLRAVFWIVTVASIFFAAWSYLSVESAYRRFSFAWAITFGVIALIRLGQLGWQKLMK
jgi:hypothetical protein